MIAPPRTNFVAMTALFYLGLVLLVFAAGPSPYRSPLVPSF
jgi:hypothetical protein